MKSILNLAFLGTLLFATSCGSEDDKDVSYIIPETYSFSRNGETSVSYQGQTDRLNMLSEIKTYLKKGDGGEVIDADLLLNMFSNQNSPFISADLNASTKQIEDKTYALDIQFYKDLFEEAEAISKEVNASAKTAKVGEGGQIERVSNRSFVNVNAKGWEFTQMAEKGLMGALIYNQIFNSYLTAPKVGEGVENTELVDGENYTTMEHHWDEAFGYFGVPSDFPNGDPILSDGEARFWAEYTLGRDADLGIANKLMGAYITGRAAIVAKDYETKDQQIILIQELHELVAAATAVHYLNAALGNIASPDQGNLFHHLSEAYGFINAIRFIPTKKLTTVEIETILNSNLGTDGDFWTVTTEGLEAAKSTFATNYPELSPMIDSI